MQFVRTLLFCDSWKILSPSSNPHREHIIVWCSGCYPRQVAVCAALLVAATPLLAPPMYPHGHLWCAHPTPTLHAVL